jgi:plastocyanin
MNPKVYLRDRILAPLGLTILAAVLIVTIIINLSRVLLAVANTYDNTVALFVSSGVALAILGTAVWASTRPRHLSAPAGMFVLASAGILSLVAGSISFNGAQDHGEEGAEAVPFAAEQVVVGQPGSGPLVFDPDTISAAVGPDAPGLRIDLTSDAGDHTFVVEGHESEFKLAANPSSPDSGVLVLDPGDYVFYCDVAGHRAAGMEGTLTLTSDPAAQPIGGTGEEGGEGGEPAAAE